MACSTYLSHSETFTLPENALQDGTHTVMYKLNGLVAHQSQFEGTIGQPLEIPNIFPEVGTFAITIVQPDGEPYLFIDNCAYYVDIVHSCGGVVACIPCDQ